MARAVLTHAHSDHARPGSDSYLAARPSKFILQNRLGNTAFVQYLNYGEKLQLADVQLSLHPAGHILGSAQVRIEHRGEVWVFSGDYKIQPDKTCLEFESINCHTFITESTFGLPIYRWKSNQEIFEQINQWWMENREHGRASVLYCHALGKAQRILSGVEPTIGAIYTHGAVENLTQAYRDEGIDLPNTIYVASVSAGTSFGGGLVLAPPSAAGSKWLRQFAPYSTGYASGWMRVRGTRRRKSVDRGFALSDHADWPGLLNVIASSGAQKVIVTHGNISALTRWLTEQGLKADSFDTEFETDNDNDSEPDKLAP